MPVGTKKFRPFIPLAAPVTWKTFHKSIESNISATIRMRRCAIANPRRKQARARRMALSTSSQNLTSVPKIRHWQSEKEFSMFSAHDCTCFLLAS
jgi:hypothetical protein